MFIVTEVRLDHATMITDRGRIANVKAQTKSGKSEHYKSEHSTNSVEC